MKYLLLLITTFFTFTKLSFAQLKDGITSGLAVNTNGDSVSLGGIAGWLKGELFTITFVIAVAAIVFVGIKMVFSLGKPEEFKKAWMHFVYVIIGVFLVYASLGIVMLVVNLANNL